MSPTFLRAALFLLMSAVPACSDARGAFDDFNARYDRLNDGPSGADAGPCEPPDPGVISGRALIAIGTTISPGRPILFLGELTTPELDGRTSVYFRYRPLDASDRKTPVGDELELGPYAIAPDGSFVAPTGEATLPGEANALLPGVPITSDLTLHGRICGTRDFYCGAVTGEASYPVVGPVEGSFGLDLVTGDLPERPLYGCAPEAIAVPLGE